MKAPNGWQEICAFYTLPSRMADGQISEAWKRQNLVIILAPFTLDLAWGGSASRITCHHKIADILRAALEAIQEAKLGSDYLAKDYGGCFQDRAIRGAPQHLSLHAFGAALDFRIKEDQLGTLGEPEMREAAKIFKRFGFTWGGDFGGRKDPMHFQYASGY